jgi:hypothetical protein
MNTEKKKKKKEERRRRRRRRRRENLSWVFFLTFPISPTPSNVRMMTLVLLCPLKCHVALNLR